MNSHPPKPFLRFFRWYCHPKLVKHIEGDLMELYGERIRDLGKRRADLKFIVDVIMLLRPGIIKPWGGFKLNQYDMYTSYLKIGWRNLKKNGGYSFINIGGKILQGRDFSRDIASDSSAMILNEAMVDYMGFEEPIGQVVRAYGIDYTVIGVVENMNTNT